MAHQRFFVYIMASQSRVLYVGLTRDLLRRVYQHRHGTFGGFTARYRVTKLVYFEETNSIRVAITRERQLKAWTRHKKIELIESSNRGWVDLAAGWLGAD